jgi:hypothetical protein
MSTSDAEHADMTRLDLPTYPKAFIASARLNKQRDRVFAVMPFTAPHSDQLWEILRKAADITRLDIRRVDERTQPTAIVSDILEEIERAEIIIADLGGLNPNVLYEVGIAHVRCDFVVLLYPQGQPLPFNLAGIRCISYDLSCKKHQAELTDRLIKTLQGIKSVGPPTIIESALERTTTIIADLQSLENRPTKELSKQCVWFSGSLSAFAIDEEEPFEPGEQAYHEALLEEKKSLLSLARRGCAIRCILTPPMSPLIYTHRLEVFVRRLQNLLRFLDSDVAKQKKVECVVSPFRQKNLYIIGHISYLEGYKQGTQRGYGLNLRQTDPNAIRSNIALYEALFKHLKNQTLREYGRRGQGRKTSLRLATRSCVRKSIAVVSVRSPIQSTTDQAVK